MSSTEEVVAKDVVSSAAEGETESTPTANVSTREEVMVTLLSSDGAKFEVEESAVRMSSLLGAMIDDVDASSTAVQVQNVDSRMLTKLIAFCKHHVRAGSTKDETAPDGWNKKFLDTMNDDELKEVMIAASYLKLKPLLEITAQKAADTVKDMTVEEVCEYFGIEKDCSPEEEEKYREKHQWAFQ